MAALVALMETLRTGDHVAAPRIMYHGGQTWLRRMQELRGVEVTFFDATEPGALEAALRPGRTKLLWIESPTNPTWDVIDIAAAAEAAHAAGARLAVDCTVAPPCTSRALELGADVAFHSGTKYLGGHSDLTAGVLSVAVQDALWTELRQMRSLMGSVIAAVRGLAADPRHPHALPALRARQLPARSPSRRAWRRTRASRGSSTPACPATPATPSRRGR